MADSFDLLADYADQIHSSTLGAPVESSHFQSTKKKINKNKARVPISVKPVSDSFIPKKDNIVINTETAEIIESCLRDLYELVNTKDDSIIKLLRSNNKMLDRVVNTVTDWYGYEKEKDLLAKLEKKGNSELEEALDDAKQRSEDAMRRKEERRRQREMDDNSNGNGSGIDLDLDPDGKTGKRKKGNRTRPDPNSPKKSMWRKIKDAGLNVIKKGGGTAKKVAALLATGALAAGSAVASFPSLGAANIGTRTPEALQSALPESFVPEVERAPTTTEEKPTKTPPKENAAHKSIANAMGEGLEKPSMLSKGFKWIKNVAGSVAPKALTALSIASAGVDAYNIETDPTLTREEKNKSHAGTAGQVVGTMGAATAGSVVGGLIGGAIGTLTIPGVGTVGGAALGSEIGGLIAGTAATILASDQLDKAGKAVYDFFVKDIHEDKPQRIQLALDEVKVKTDQDGKESSWLPDFLKPFSERSYGSPTMSASYSGSTGYSGIPQTYRNVVNGTASAGDIGGYENVPALGVLKDLKGVDRTEDRLSQWNDLFEKNGAKHGVDPRLIRAVTKQESKGFTDVAHATSHAGAGGLMQLMPDTAREQGVMNAYDPEQNVNGGSKYLAKWLRKYKGNVPLALAAYNAGSGNVDKAIAKAGTTDPDAVLAALPQVTGNHAKETQEYVRNITGFYADYKKQTDKNGITKADYKKPDTKQVTAEKKAETTVPETQPTNLVEKRPEVKPASVVAKPIMETARNDLTSTIPAYNPPPATPAPVTQAPLPPQSQGRSASVGMTASNNKTTIPTLDDMPMMIDEFGLTHLSLGGA